MQLQEIQDVFCDNSCLTDSLMKKKTFRAALVTPQHFREVGHAFLEDHFNFEKSKSLP